MDSRDADFHVMPASQVASSALIIVVDLAISEVRLLLDIEGRVIRHSRAVVRDGASQ